jgi:hypothetical protein
MEYLSCPEANLKFPCLPEEHEIVVAINDFLFTPSNLTFKDLQTILAVLYCPLMLQLLVH